MSATLRALRSLASTESHRAAVHDARSQVFGMALSWANVLPLGAVIAECTARRDDSGRSAVERTAYADLVLTLEKPEVEVIR